MAFLGLKGKQEQITRHKKVSIASVNTPLSLQGRESI